MGHHFVPQAHQRRFECPEQPGYIWTYDTVERRFLQLPIKKVAQARDYYPTDVEVALNEIIEGPGNGAIQKLIRHEELDNKERTQLSLYLFTMATRGPGLRRKVQNEIVPKAVEDTLQDLETALHSHLDKVPYDLSALRQLMELEGLREKHANHPPQSIVNCFRTPFWSERTLACVHQMAWLILPAPPGRFFLTCDTPTHIDVGGTGVGTPQSELTFAMSKDFALIGCYAGKRGTVEYVPAQENLVDEVNCRMANCAERFILSHAKEGWIADLADKRPPITPIEWLTPIAILQSRGN